MWSTRITRVRWEIKRFNWRHTRTGWQKGLRMLFFSVLALCDLSECQAGVKPLVQVFGWSRVLLPHCCLRDTWNKKTSRKYNRESQNCEQCAEFALNPVIPAMEMLWKAHSCIVTVTCQVLAFHYNLSYFVVGVLLYKVLCSILMVNQHLYKEHMDMTWCSF